MAENKVLWLRSPCNKNSHLTKLTFLEQLAELEYERQWQEEGQSDGHAEEI